MCKRGWEKIINEVIFVGGFLLTDNLCTPASALDVRLRFASFLVIRLFLTFPTKRAAPALLVNESTIPGDVRRQREE